MKATYLSENGLSSIISLIFNPEKPADKAKAEAVEKELNNIGYESIIEEEGMIQVATMGLTIAEMREDYKQAKQAAK